MSTNQGASQYFYDLFELGLEEYENYENIQFIVHNLIKDNSDSVNSEEDFEEMYPYFDEELENNSESLFQLLNDNMKIYKDKRLLLTYHGNLKSTQKRRKASTKENINKNEKNSHEEMTQNNDSQSSETVNNELGIVDNFQKKLSINYDDLIKDIEINHLMLQKVIV
ncbi:6398_t:CDS:2 [Entrophospora sp. SA101]|nr:6398_t:CDS:2 [Entrophospora sp. SA101]